ncbi:hypothetical protein H310_06086 [Aphanomyces invadans]|uniref:Uncharacterized protein n=1 Tax=Aphanomyces invadans TaxID=157072 RepID=A0A024U850_9STRA|nr:hypothetical protein H310_06086 [Aphanomyces invadans]ETW02621.1 hypothetical protein H310_06086 [Aphanomyces invadans]|eukprot:XP_008869226.1 hypothetical protein H310_06086 [Aphanomyces invadans]
MPARSGHRVHRSTHVRGLAYVRIPLCEVSPRSASLVDLMQEVCPTVCEFISCIHLTCEKSLRKECMIIPMPFECAHATHRGMITIFPEAMTLSTLAQKIRVGLITQRSSDRYQEVHDEVSAHLIWIFQANEVCRMAWRAPRMSTSSLRNWRSCTLPRCSREYPRQKPEERMEIGR